MLTYKHHNLNLLVCLAVKYLASLLHHYIDEKLLIELIIMDGWILKLRRYT